MRGNTDRSEQQGAGSPRVLILSASTGNGHMSAARALERELAGRGLSVKSVDTLDYASRGFRAWYRGGYELLVKRQPRFWGTLYRSSDKARLAYRFQTVLDEVFVSRIRGLVRTFQPDWVLCTHSLPQPLLDRVRRKRRGFRMAIVVTDLYPHRMWLRGRPDRFFVAGEWSKEILEQRYAPSRGHIDVTGIPIDPVFGEPEDRAEARARTGISGTAPLVLLSSGGIGGGPMVQACRALAGMECEAEVIALCGRNQRLRAVVEQRMASLPSGGKVRVDPRGLISQPEMATAMRAADLLVGKPGGLTTSEALASGLPFVVYAPFLIPGQEEGNAEFLASTGAGVICRDPRELRQTVQELLGSPERLAAMRSAALALGRPAAAKAIVDRLVALSAEQAV